MHVGLHPLQIHFVAKLSQPYREQNSERAHDKADADIRLRNAIARSSNPDLFPKLNIPRSTAFQWIREGVKRVVAHPSLKMSKNGLVDENIELRKGYSIEREKNLLVQLCLKVCDFQMQYVLVKAAELKEKLLEGIA